MATPKRKRLVDAGEHIVRVNRVYGYVEDPLSPKAKDFNTELRARASSGRPTPRGRVARNTGD